MSQNRGASDGLGSGWSDASSHAAIVLALIATYCWAPEVFRQSVDYFRAVTIENYGTSALSTLEFLYFWFLHIVLFVVARMAIQVSITALLGAGAYRLFA